MSAVLKHVGESVRRSGLGREFQKEGPAKEKKKMSPNVSCLPVSMNKSHTSNCRISKCVPKIIVAYSLKVI